MDAITNRPVKPYLTSADMPTGDAEAAELAEARTALEVARDERRGEVLTIAGMAAGGLVAGAGVFIGGLAVGARGGNVARNLGGVMLTVGGMGAVLSAVAGLAEIANKYDYTRPVHEAESAVRTAQERLRVATAQREEIGPGYYNAIATDIVAAYDHNGDGSVDWRAGQPLEADERMRLATGGPATAKHERVVHVDYFVEHADQNGDGMLSGREIARNLLNGTTHASWVNEARREAFEARSTEPLEDAATGSSTAIELGRIHDAGHSAW